jgi:hypothetical protein
MTDKTLYLGDHPLNAPTSVVEGDYVIRDGESFYRIANMDGMEDFFISVVSDSNHWMFISTRGGLSAGRTDCDSALFPYYTEDKIQDNSANTGSRTLVIAEQEGKRRLWEPFSRSHTGVYKLTRNLYKNVLGDKLIFEELNHDLGLKFTYSWSTSDRFGFVKQSTIAAIENAKSTIEIIDGIENLLPYGVLAGTQNELSCLVDAYKKNELVPNSGLAVYAMSSILSDKAEPSEALSATTVWSFGTEGAKYLISSNQLSQFRSGQAISEEQEVLGRRGAYFVHQTFDLSHGEERSWGIVADVNQGPAAVRDTLSLINSDADIRALIHADIEKGSRNLERLISTADGIQMTGDTLSANHHASNVLFNIMRGGLFIDNYAIEKRDLASFCADWNVSVFDANTAFFEALPDSLTYHELEAALANNADRQLERLCREYLPLSFSRRHGDPSRPWNRFAIKVKDEKGAKLLNYEGNWRDIFQNWEALSSSIPCFGANMISKFVNATTADGYNPYRITRQGIDWERPEPENPWANIGYWGDHQLIYLLKLIEQSVAHNPAALKSMMFSEAFAYANVPYRIKSYASILSDPYDTIEFDEALDREIDARVEAMGADGRLMPDPTGGVYQVNLAEKILVTLLSKIANFVPDAGIWMNTQRPEWNDANNALVGTGVSVVTLCYLHRFLNKIVPIFAELEQESVSLSNEVADFMAEVVAVLETQQGSIASGPVSDAIRKDVMEALGTAAERYRNRIYQKGFSAEKRSVALSSIVGCLSRARDISAISIRSNRREDGLYHAYNRIVVSDSGVQIKYLYEMLEGQVAVLSSELLEAEESLSLLKTLRASSLYTERQHSYLLYPNRHLPRFMERNLVPTEFVASSKLMTTLLESGNTDLVERDQTGQVYFAGKFNNTASVAAELAKMAEQGYAEDVSAEGNGIENLFSELFDCANFTGRSGGMYAYEGLGSIYWHMVSKLLLAVMETVKRAEAMGASEMVVAGLKAAYYDVREGIGFNKTPDVYGAFPTDPYSHTPDFAGARQPGMTGQVKEEVLTRLLELGVEVADACVSFKPTVLRKSEFLDSAATLRYFDVTGASQEVALKTGELCFTYCQVPVVMKMGESASITLHTHDGGTESVTGNALTAEQSEALFKKNGRYARVDVRVERVMD